MNGPKSISKLSKIVLAWLELGCFALIIVSDLQWFVSLTQCFRQLIYIGNCISVFLRKGRQPRCSQENKSSLEEFGKYISFPINHPWKLFAEWLSFLLHIRAYFCLYKRKQNYYKSGQIYYKSEHRKCL